jgi:hypothetical protein
VARAGARGPVLLHTLFYEAVFHRPNEVEGLGDTQTFEVVDQLSADSSKVPHREDDYIDLSYCVFF